MISPFPPFRINSAGLINDGLTSNCTNNNGTTWTYNQGVLLNGLGLLSQATGNASLLDVARGVANAVATHLSPGGILTEPCTRCDMDQHLFKGIYMRHLASYLAVDPGYASTAGPYIAANAASALRQSQCSNGGYGLSWSSSCVTESTASSSAALDLLVASSVYGPPTPGVWRPLGLGNCADTHGNPMPNCFARVNATVCEAAATALGSIAVAYDHYVDCLATSPFCRVRVTAGSDACPSGWEWGGGSGTAVNATNGNSLTECYVRTSQ